MTAWGTCIDCGRERMAIVARGRCGACYREHRRGGPTPGPSPRAGRGTETIRRRLIEENDRRAALAAGSEAECERLRAEMDGLKHQLDDERAFRRELRLALLRSRPAAVLGKMNRDQTEDNDACD